MLPNIHAHRGASAYAPENTLEAFELAISMKADFIELDVHLTRDKKIVVIHDDIIDRVSDGTGTVAEMTYEELLKFNFNNQMPKFKNVKIPLLEEVYNMVLNTPLQMNVEIKSHFGEIEEKLLRLEKKAGMEGRVLYSSFYHESLAKLLKLNRKGKVGLLYSKAPERPAQHAKRFGAYALHGEYHQFLTPDIMGECKKYDIKTNFWTVDEKIDIRRCIEAGVDGIITNRPDVAVKIRSEIK